MLTNTCGQVFVFHKLNSPSIINNIVKQCWTFPILLNWKSRKHWEGCRKQEKSMFFWSGNILFEPTGGQQWPEAPVPLKLSHTAFCSATALLIFSRTWLRPPSLLNTKIKCHVPICYPIFIYNFYHEWIIFTLYRIRAGTLVALAPSILPYLPPDVPGFCYTILSQCFHHLLHKKGCIIYIYWKKFLLSENELSA